MTTATPASNDHPLPGEGEEEVEQLRRALEDVLDEINRTLWRDGCGFALSGKTPPVARAREVLAALGRN